ncbi:MAG TPA: C25 family cysteine peptidase [Candidatus Acidoferrales bacterium]|nr:C25 family cysteine peptidase [Candidatus Acidoferrales bacterium]
MRPNILEGDIAVVAPVLAGELRRGDIVLTRSEDGFLLHRVVGRDAISQTILTRGDAGQQNDTAEAAVLGRVIAIERDGKTISFTKTGTEFRHAVRAHVHRLIRAGALRARRFRAAFAWSAVMLLALLLHASPAAAQFTTTDTAAPATQIAAGGTITYTQVLTYTGILPFIPSGILPVKTTQPVPGSTTYVSFAVAGVASANWGCVLGGGTVTCTDSSGSVTYFNGNTTTITITVTINGGTAVGTVITDSVTATPGGSNATANTTVGATPDLAMTADSAAPSPVATGANITYTETVTNNSATVAAAGATLTQNTPANTLFQSVTPPAGWTCGTQPAVGGTGAIICTANGDFNASATATFTVVVQVRPEAAGGSTITNSVTVSETGTDPNAANNTLTASDQVIGADLSMTQVASVAAIAPGGTITYTETVTNSGPNTSTTTVLYQQTPPNTTFVSMTPPAGWACGTVPAAGGTGQVICTDGANLNSGTTTPNFTFVVTVNPGPVPAAPAAGTTIVNSADVTSQTTDLLVANNATTTSVLVETTGDSDLAISMTASPTPVFVSSTVTYTIQVTNLGLAAGTGVTVVDTLPASLVGASAVTSQGSCGVPSGGTITCNLGAVAYPLASPITITLTGTTPGTAKTMTNVATVSTTGTDPVAGNNSVTVLTVVQPLVCATPGKDGAGGVLNSVVNAYYPPGAGVGTVNAGSTSVVLGAAAAAPGAQTAIAIGDLLLVIQMQDATINTTATENSGAYGDGVPGDPGNGSPNLGSSGLFEFVTATSAVPVTGGTLSFTGTGTGGGLLNTYVNAAAAPAANPTAGQATFQVIRVPQYTSATLTSGLTAMPWNGATGGVLALDVASQLTLGGTVAVDAQGFRGGAGRNLAGQAGTLATDYVTLSTQTTNGSKGEGIAGTQTFIANAALTAVINTGNEGYPNGSYARGAPGNAGGGATDAHPTANDQNSGGGGGANGGAGGIGGFGWSSAGIVGGFGGASFSASTNAILMGGGGGAGTSNNGSFWNPSTDTGGSNCGAGCTGIASSGTAGGGIVIIHTGSVSGAGTITANGQAALETENDGGGGGGAGGTVIVFANSGGIAGLTASAVGGNGGVTWPEQVPGAFPGSRHGPGAGGGGGVILTSSAPGSASVSGGNPGWSTLGNDAYGATAGQPGIFSSGLTITQTPGTQSGAYCAGADLAVTNAGAPSPVVPGNNITYTQTATNNGAFDAVNAVFSEIIPANTTFQSIAIGGAGAAGWSCSTPAVNSAGVISCTNADVAAGAPGATTFTVVVNVNGGTATGTQITDTDSITSGTNDPNLANNTATVLTIVGAANTANLAITNSASPNPVLAGANITYTVVVTNNGPGTASTLAFTEAIPANTTLVSATATSGTGGWTCAGGSISCTNPTFAVGASTTFTVIVTVNAGTASGTVITDTASISSSTTDPNPSNNFATVTVVVATAGQADLAVTKSGTPNPVLAGNNITYTLTATNNGPAAASTVTMTDTLPANATVVSITTPAGWTCPAPSGGTQTCTNPSVAANTTATFTLILNVTAGTAPGTVLTNSLSISSSVTTDPNSANNSATTTTNVASPTQADVAIIKTASPEPVDQNTNLTYTLQVTNNGPAVAQNVVVTDVLPSQVTFTSVSIPASQGSCSYTALTTTVSCNLGSLNVGGLVIITINVTAATFSSASLSSNTATVSSSTSDPNLTNNSSTAITTIQSPTAVQIASFGARAQPGGGVVLRWQTREEARNLGFHVYREDAQGRHQLDPSLIAGSALFLRGGQPQHRAKTYQWVDPQGGTQSAYWLEDVDLNGTRAMHGPVYADSMTQTSETVAFSPLLAQLDATIALAPEQVTRALMTPRPPIVLRRLGEPPVSLDEFPAVKISVTREGWYRVTQAQLAAAGLSRGADARTLQLFAEGVEQPIRIQGRQSGPLGPSDSIEFYGTGIDTPFSGTRVYWLVRGTRPGERIPLVSSPGSGGSGDASFLFTVLFEQRTTYFAALLNGENNDNFFGAIVTSEPIQQVLTVAHVDSGSSLPVTLDVTLQGVTDLQSHRVSVAINGSPVGEMDFENQANVTKTLAVTNGALQDGANTVTLAALDGDNDVSLVQSIALHYAHTFAVDSNWLRATAAAGDTVRIHGFTNSQIHVLDITDPLEITELVGPVTFDGSSFGVTLTVPGFRGTDRTLLAFSNDQISAPAALSFHEPGLTDQPQAGADIIVITHPDFESSIGPLVRLHQMQGQSVAVVTTDEIFDAFNFGERSPFALRSYLQNAATTWRVKPRAVLLAGDASLDPRNYLGFGDFDFVPTRLIETAAFKTASDDWLTDFKQTGFATIPTGRLPVRTPADADLVVSKIVGYERGLSSGSWQSQAVVIADQNIGVDFTTAANVASADLPASLTVTKILADGQDPAAVKEQILSALNNGSLLVNYLGHGSEEQWSFADFLDDSDVAKLSNGGRLPVYLIMDCLNGFFHDVYATSLSTSLMLAPNGGAVAVWASSGFTDAAPQATMDQALLGAWSTDLSLPIGAAILNAKLGIADPDVRRTWILFGDPTMRLPFPTAPARGWRH